MSIELQQPNAPIKKNFDFVDSIRCIAMMGIIMEHSTYNGTYIYNGFPTAHIVYMSLIQIPKFGTAAFFILAGFLLGSKFVDYTPGQYLKRRLANTLIPWIMWSLLFVVTMYIRIYIETHKQPDFDPIGTIGEVFASVYLYTNYWFIINFLICIAVLLLFKRYLYSMWLGLALFLVSLVYSLNIHHEWFVPQHTTAIFGFVFFLWLGAQLNHYWDKVQMWLNKIPYWVLFILLVATFYSCIYEITNLFEYKSVDPYNTLRVSNLFYSLVAMMLLLKFQNFGFTKYFKSRETTFGLYLVHYIVVYNLLGEILRPLHLPATQTLSVLALIGVSLLRFIIVYAISFGMVSLINSTKFKWIIGR